MSINDLLIWFFYVLAGSAIGTGIASCVTIFLMRRIGKEQRKEFDDWCKRNKL